MIANSIVCNDVPCCYLLVSIPIGVIWALATTKASFFKKQITTHKVLSIHGDSDQFTRLSTFTNWTQDYKNITDTCIEGADHFWLNHEQQLIDHIDQWLKKRGEGYKNCFFALFL
jgi:alpha/beta superfamily hydrolase